MSIQKSLPTYQSIDHVLKQNSVALTASEMHGLMTGIICGGNHDSSWQTLVHDLSNDGLAFSQALAEPLRELFQMTLDTLDNSDFAFSLLLPDENKPVFERADEFAGWVNHFLLGIGVAQPKLAEKKEVEELLTDLRQIGQLGYDEAEDQEELSQALEDVLEYVRMGAQLCFLTFTQPKTASKIDEAPPTLH